MQELTKNDFEILAVINRFEPISIKEIKNKILNVDSLEYRLGLMEKQEYKHSLHTYLSNSSLILQKHRRGPADDGGYETLEPLGIYEMTDLGRKVLQDYITQERTNKKNLWLKNAWIPILVSLAINALIRGIEWLLPLIQELLSRNP